MRKLFPALPLGLALALASCGGSQQANNAAVAEQSSAADIGPVNDTTAIDAATGQAANMAADVNYTFNEEAPDENESATNRARSRPAAKPAFEPDEPTPDSPPGNTTAPGNTTED